MRSCRFFYLSFFFFAHNVWERRRGSSAQKRQNQKGPRTQQHHTHGLRHRVNACLTHPRGLVPIPKNCTKKKEDTFEWTLCDCVWRAVSTDNDEHTELIHKPSTACGTGASSQSTIQDSGNEDYLRGEELAAVGMTVLLSDSVTTLILIKCQRCPAVAALAAKPVQNSLSHTGCLQPSDKKEMINDESQFCIFWSGIKEWVNNLMLIYAVLRRWGDICHH